MPATELADQPASRGVRSEPMPPKKPAPTPPPSEQPAEPAAAAPEPFPVELLTLSIMQTHAMAAWSMVRKKSRGKWTADVDRWSQLANADPGEIKRLLEVMLAAGFIDRAGELVPAVATYLRSVLAARNPGR